MTQIKCDTCLNSSPIISENGIKYNCRFSSKRVIKCIMNNWCYYNEIKFNEDGSIKIVDIMESRIKMVREYTPIVDGFQIRDIVYITALNKYPENPTKFDIVKWEECEPHTAIDGETGEERQITKYCYSVGRLEWSPKFEFESIGLRWLESNPSERVIKMILGFCSMMESILNENYD